MRRLNNIVASILLAAMTMTGCNQSPKTDEAQEPLTIDGVTIDEKLLDDNGTTFTLTVHAELSDPQYAQLINYRLESKDGKVCKDSEDGHFKSVPANGNEYTLTAYIPMDDTVEPYTEDVKAPEPAVIDDGGGDSPPVTKVTVAMVQGWINGLKNSNTANPLIDTRGNTLVERKCTYHMTGLVGTDSVNTNTRADKIAEKFMYSEWSDVKVTSIKCDEKTGKLRHVEGKVVYPN